MQRPWHKLAKRVEELPESPSDEELHAIRIRTKRARYAAEAATPVVGKQARAFAHAAAELQEVLGELNDAVVAARWLEHWATQHGGENARVAESLVALEGSAAEHVRGDWRTAWEELAAPELRAWM